VEVAFGPFAGFLSGVLVWLLGTLAVAAVSVVFATNAGELVPFVRGGVGRALFLAGVFAALSLVNVWGVEKGTRFNAVFTVAKLLPLLLLIVAAPFFVSPASLAFRELPAAAEVSRTSMLLLFAFCGVESALLPSGEVREPARTVPRAIFIAMVAVTLLYIGLQAVAQGVLGSDLAGAPTPLAETAGRMFGPWGRALLLVGASVSMFGYVSGMILAVPRALFAFARDGFLPRVLASVHPRFRTPHVAIAAQSTLAFLLAVTGSFGRLAILASLSVIVLYLACCLAALRLRARNVRAGGTPFDVPGARFAPLPACAVILWLLSGVRASEWLALAVALVAASLVFVATAPARARRA
jgi:amino acid transporter